MKFKGWLYVLYSGLFLAAAILLVLLQWGNSADFSLYGKNLPGVNVALLMVLCVLGGLKARWAVKVLFRGLGLLREVRKAQKLAEAAARKAAPETPA